MWDQGHLGPQEEVYTKDQVKIIQRHIKQTTCTLSVIDLHGDILGYPLDLLGFAIDCLDSTSVLLQLKSQPGCFSGGPKVVSGTIVHQGLHLHTIYNGMDMH